MKTRGSVDSDIIYFSIILYNQLMEAVSRALDPCSLLRFREAGTKGRGELQVLVDHSFCWPKARRSSEQACSVHYYVTPDVFISSRSMDSRMLRPSQCLESGCCLAAEQEGLEGRGRLKM